MKKQIVFYTCLVLCMLLLLPALADGHPEALYPARGENGLWGYIDQTGAFVILPQYTAVSPARGSPLVSGLFMAVSDDGESWGLINDSGDKIFPQEYVITWNQWDFAIYSANSEDVTAAWALSNGTQKAGYFNTNYGVFSGFLWKQIALSDDKMGLMPVSDDSGLWGYANTDLNYGPYETVIPCQFAEAAAFTVNGGEVYDTGWAVAGYPQDENGHTEYVLVSSVDGNLVHPPEGYILDINQPVTENKAIIYTLPMDNAGDDLMESCGFMDTEGNILWLMENEDIDLWPYDGRYCVAYNYLDGHGYYLDENGHVLESVYARPEGYGGYAFCKGITSVFVEDHPAAMDDEGNVLFVMEGENIYWLWNFMDNGLAWYMEKWHGEADERWYEKEKYGLVDRNGNILTPSDFWCYEESGAPFSFGLAAVQCIQGDGLYGYLNEQGQWAIEPRFYYAGEFQGLEDGLAYVKTAPDRHAYIDLQGNEIYAWTTNDVPNWEMDLPKDTTMDGLP